MVYVIKFILWMYAHMILYVMMGIPISLYCLLSWENYGFKLIFIISKYIDVWLFKPYDL